MAYVNTTFFPKTNLIKDFPTRLDARIAKGRVAMFFQRVLDTIYQIARSVRFNSADSANLRRTNVSAGNRKTWTWSGWVKRSKLGSDPQALFASTDNATATTGIFFGVYNIWGAEDAITFYTDRTGAYTVTTTSVLRDPSAWYHIVIAVDTTQATTTDRVKAYVNGAEQTLTGNFPLQDFETEVNRASFTHSIGRHDGGTWYLSSYLANIHFIDGQALDPTSFGEFDTNGVWQPIAYTGTYGTNGFHLPFSDNSTAAALGTDASGNGNDWTVNNISVAAGVGNDSLLDTPTDYGTDTGLGGEVRGNYATLNPLAKGGTHALSNGNLDFLLSGSSGSTSTFGTIGVSSGKWYWELTVTGTGVYYPGIGVETNPVPSVQSGGNTTGYAYLITGEKLVNNTLTAYGASFTTGDIVSVALNMDAGTLTCYKNGVSQGQLVSGITGTAFPVIIGQLSASGSLNFGQRPFAYPAPSGFKALCTQNLPEPTIADGSTVMDVKLYTGNGSTQTISGLGFSPDLVWIKNRSSTYSHNLYDVIRGANNALFSNTTDAVISYTDRLSSFNSDGFTLGAGTAVNGNSLTFAAWTWDAGSSTVTNNDGTITSQVRANASAGFSIATFTTPASGNFTAGHGLGVSPEFVICKGRNTGGSWITYHKSAGAGNYLDLNGTAAAIPNTTVWQNTDPSSTVIYGSTSAWGFADYVMYCFAPVEGYSAFGSYTGNGSADGPFVYTGFRPRWVMIKASSGISDGPWMLYDTARNTYNLTNNKLYANESSAENASSGGDTSGTNSIDILSNGFKHRQANYFVNGSGNTYIYAAFAEHPFKHARAR